MCTTNAAIFTPSPIIIPAAASARIFCGIPCSLMSAKLKLPTFNPIARKPRRRITAPTCVQKKNNKATLRLASYPHNAIMKNAGISITSKKT